MAGQEKRLFTQRKNLVDGKDIATVEISDINKEHGKFRGDSGNHIFVFFTDQKFEDYSKLKDNEIVIDYTLMPLWMGSKLAMLRAFNFQYKPVQNPIAPAESTIVEDASITIDVQKTEKVVKKRKFVEGSNDTSEL